MLEQSRDRIHSSLGPDDTVLDVGGWADPLPRADWVIDVLPYETRGLYEREGWVARGDGEPERFDARTWIQRDVCDREPFPFGDGDIDFVVCSHTLEDLRDPLWVCREMTRVGKAGYIEVPSRLEEQCHGFEGPWTGWSHHRWLIDVNDTGLTFVAKLAALHASPGGRLPQSLRDGLTEEDRVQTLWWTREFSCDERLFFDGGEYEGYLSAFAADAMRGRATPRGARSRFTRRLRRR